MESELTEYIRTELKKGFSRKAIRTVLLKDGYDERSIDEAFHGIRDGKKAIIVAAIIIVIALALAWLLLFRNAGNSEIKAATTAPNLTNAQSNPQATQQQGTAAQTTPQAPYTQDEAAAAETAISAGSLQGCSSAGALKGYCMAVVERNAEECNNAPAELKEACILRIARLNKDSGLCSGLTTLKDNCYLQLALLTNDTALCSNAGKGKDYCLKQIK